MRLQFDKLFLVVMIFFIASCDHLRNDEIAQVQFNSTGCFGAYHSELKLFETRGLQKAMLVNGDSTYTTILSEEKLNSFYDFLTDLKSAKKQNGLCTTDQSCIAFTRDGTITKKHIECSWEGFDYLLGALFGDRGLGKIVRYEMKMPDTAINTDFSIRFGNYELFFNVPQINSWCDKMMKSKDGLEPVYKSIKQEVNHQGGDYLTENHSWLLALFTPGIVNVTTKEQAKSLLVKYIDSVATDYFVITNENDTIQLFTR